MKMFSQNKGNDKPDFAFPKNVEATADNDLKAALGDQNGDLIVNALIRKSLAQNLQDSENPNAIIGSIAGVAARTDSPAARALLALLQVRVLADIYQSDRYTIGERPDVLTDRSANDINLWGRARFLEAIRTLCAQALADPHMLASTPISDFPTAIDCTPAQTVYYPSLLEFCVMQAVNGLMPFAEQGMLSSGLALDPLDSSLYPPAATVSGTILRCYVLAIEGNRHRPAAINAMVNMLDFVCQNAFDLSDEQRYDAYLRSYYRFINSEYAVEFLLKCPRSGFRGHERQLYAMLSEFSDLHGDYPNLAAITNMLNDFEAQSLEVHYPGQGAPGADIEVEVTARNVDSATLTLYDVTHLLPKHTDQSTIDTSTHKGKKVAQYPVAFTPDSIPYDGRATVRVHLPAPGYYYIAAKSAKVSSDTRYASIVHCSTLTGAVFSTGRRAHIVVADAQTGAPVEGASLLFKPWSRNSQTSPLATPTDAGGFATTDKEERGDLLAIKGDDRFSPWFGYSLGWKHSADKRLCGSVFTSLGLYRPGDTVDYCALLYHSDNGTNAPASGEEVTIMLRDANWQAVETHTLTTDTSGRIADNFTLPATGLTGNFTIEVKKVDNTVCRGSFTVSDYKLPTFEVTADVIERPSAPGQPARIAGRATTYAGFPVEGAQVAVQLKVRTGFWWWATTSPTFWEGSAVTGPDGSYELTVAADVISGSPCPRGFFLADVAVTSPDGETHEASTGFNLGKPLSLNLSVPSVILQGSSAGISLDINAVNKDVALPGEIAYIIVGTNAEADCADYRAEGLAAPSALPGIVAELPVGRYSVKVSTPDPDLANPAEASDILVYRAEAGAPTPSDELLWMPHSSVKANADGTATLLVGTPEADTHALVITLDSRGAVDRKQWVRLSRGINSIPLLTDEKATAPTSVYIGAVRAMNSSVVSAKVLPPDIDKALRLEISTFRNHVVPGEAETVTLRVSPVAGADSASWLIVDMASKAIDALAPNPLGLSLGRGSSPSIWHDGWEFRRLSSRGSWCARALKTERVYDPTFRLYGLSFGPHRVFERALCGSAKMRASSNSFDSDEISEEMYMLTTGSAMTEEESNEELIANTAADSGAEQTANDAEQYRPSEIPLAFFRPMLATDSTGCATLTYTVPDANTAWLLRALAYNASMLTSSAQVEIVSAKPLMVSLNAPRFVRTGDSLVLRGSVMNATDTALVATTVIEVLHSATGSVVARAERTDTITPMGRIVPEVPFSVGYEAPGLTLRIRSTAEVADGGMKVADGEQTLIPVLPSAQDVTESQMFYIAPDDPHFTLDVPPVGPDGRAWLHFTENPSWEVVSALPGLRNNDIDSSIEAAAALFSAAVADGLMRQYPEVAMALRRWSENPADSTLVSALEKNRQLKSILLSATPWVADGLSQTERMQRLSLLLDRRNIRRDIQQAVDRLSRCVTADGGWCWTPAYPFPSQWCTGQILDLMGDLNMLGWLPDNSALADMIARAVKWIDAEAATEYSRYPDTDFTLYCYTRRKFPHIKQSSAARKVTDTTVKRIINNWKQHSEVIKAADAQIINAEGYNATARQILESLRQFATVSPTRGMWWPQLRGSWFFSMDKVGGTAIILDAFRQVDPTCPDIDRIRQWLILNKHNNDWGNAPITAQVISSILTTGRPLKINSASTAIHLGDTLLPAPDASFAVGEWVTPVADLLRTEGATLTIDRRADYPSVGAIVTMRVLPMEQVEATGCEDLAVEKALSVYEGGQWVPSTSFAVGDRVKVALTLVVNADMQYVVINDMRAAGLEPAEQLPTPLVAEGLYFYRENRDSQTNLYINRLPRGRYLLEYELFATQSGTFACGVAQAQSLYNPDIAAHSAGSLIEIK